MLNKDICFTYSDTLLIEKNKMIPELFIPSKGFGSAVYGSERKYSGRRRLADISGRTPLPIIYNKLMNSKGWLYKGPDKNKYRDRDKALIATTIISGGRIYEVLYLKKNQIIETSNKHFKMISNFPVSKRRGGDSKKGVFLDYRSEVAIPLEGASGLWSELVPFTELLLNYIKTVPDGSNRLFPFSSTRAWQIIDASLGVWCHYLRAVSESHLMRIMKDSVIVGRYMKVNPDTLAKYVQTDWRDYI